MVQRKKLKPYNKSNSIPRHEGKMNIVWHPDTNDCKIYKYFFWMPCLNMERTYIFKFGLIAFLDMTSIDNFISPNKKTNHNARETP